MNAGFSFYSIQSGMPVSESCTNGTRGMTTLQTCNVSDGIWMAGASICVQGYLMRVVTCTVGFRGTGQTEEKLFQVIFLRAVDRILRSL
ncbi:MAG: hypothetical protein PHZ27_00520 [Candidatus Omnitrophica bacterium]|nr:hypothetical protein [Candidatus Omnitrophota bacterium]MDD5440680.1 hypothetical protein [Candidatus Omnitrophota bacterium]